MNGAAFGGVGVSITTFRRADTDASAVFQQTISNVGDDFAQLGINYQIPNLEAAILAPPSTSGVLARAKANLNVNVIHSSGFEEFFEVFNYEVQIQLPSGGGVEIFRSPNLLNEQGDGEGFTTGFVSGVRYASFGGTRLFPTIPPDGRMEITYFLEAFGDTVTPELAYQAFVGDPFDISLGGGFEIGLVQAPSPVPEPADIVLVAGGLAGMLLARHARRRRLRTNRC